MDYVTTMKIDQATTSLTARSDLSISQQSYDIKVAEWTSSLLANRKKCRSREAS